jgi:putative addiction module killer protein
MSKIQIATYKEVRYYKDEKGKEPFVEWLNSLRDKVIKTRILRRIDRLRLGNYGDYKLVAEGVYELRLFFGNGYRIYFGEIGNTTVVLLLCGGNKKTQQKDIKRAEKYWRQYNE